MSNNRTVVDIANLISALSAVPHNERKHVVITAMLVIAANDVAATVLPLLTMMVSCWWLG
ncbi:MAG: hypothetical protein RQ966_12905 [Acetobacteraceae bacterium]|nr:hypothetical protein [Acetobacteraceae bacterium]